ncbi:MAG: type II toxin-antitoxin system HicB family antitoxin [Pseudomonadota bacterium]
MTREFTVVVERDTEGYFVATVPSLPGCHTQAQSRDELDERIREAIAACLDETEEIPPALELIAVERVVVAV